MTVVELCAVGIMALLALFCLAWGLHAGMVTVGVLIGASVYLLIGAAVAGVVRRLDGEQDVGTTVVLVVAYPWVLAALGAGALAGRLQERRERKR